MSDQFFHTYFLDRCHALEAAEEGNVVRIGCRQELQLCYYDGLHLENGPDNLIFVPIEQFSHFFKRTSLPVPSRFLDQTGRISTGELTALFIELVEQVTLARNEQFEIAHGSPFQDTYFIDRQIALHTALQQNRVRLHNPVVDGLQICYYDGVPFKNGPRNLVHVPMDKLLDFLINTKLRLPRDSYSPVTDSEESRYQFEKHFHTLLYEANKSSKLFLAGEEIY